MSEFDIKPCPFCGKRGYLKEQIVPSRRRGYNGYSGRYYVHCKNLNCAVKPSTSREYINPSLAIAAWNKRSE